jgi:integrase
MGIFGFLEKQDETQINQKDIMPFIDSVKISMERLFIETVIKSGLPPKDLNHIRYSDIDFQSSAVYIYDKKQKLHVIYMPYELLTKYKALELKGSMPIFNYTEYNMNEMLKRHTQQFFGKPKSWHALRLTYLLTARDAGVPLDVVSENMQVAPNVLIKYWKHTPEEKRRYIDVVNEKIN